jgi:Ni,Fe-hydrogenase III large subunit
MTKMNYIAVKNCQAVALKDIPEYNYQDFFDAVLGLMVGYSSRHCVNYFGFSDEDKIRLICCVADDETKQIYILSSSINHGSSLSSLTAYNHNFEKFEREIHENFNVRYTDHPWLKPLRYLHNRANQGKRIENYPFYNSESEELHEVGVGPIHAGIIEPGHFRFICNGEQIMHLEIQLGYQHRGIENLFLQKREILERASLAESIAGDTTVGHTAAFVNLWESLSEYPADHSLHYMRTLALELERIAAHTGDLSAICTDIAYQLGSSVYGRLRTPIINFFQEWCGNRFAKGLIRAGKMNYPFNNDLAFRLIEILNAFEPDFCEMTEELFKLPSVLSRIEKTGVLTYDQALEIGTVGMAARMCGLKRDVRLSHPYNLYDSFVHNPITKNEGDVSARVQVRTEEIMQSISYVRELIKAVPADNKIEHINQIPTAGTFVVSLVEGWRGEICHCAATDNSGNLVVYKIKDPSFHNWMALAQAVRNNEISDFPLCNKSFNLSYCGHDL